MGRLNHDAAVKILRSKSSLAELARAVASLADDPATKPEELLPALDQPGYVAESAAIALHKMTNTPWVRGKPILSRREWEVRIKLEALSALIEEELQEKGKVVVPGLMKIVVVKKPAVPRQVGINPFTKKKQFFRAQPGRRVVEIRQLKRLKEMAK